MQGYAWLYLIAYPIDYIIYAYNYIYGFSLFADVTLTDQRPFGTVSPSTLEDFLPRLYLTLSEKKKLSYAICTHSDR